MQNIQRTFWACLIVLTLLWVAAEPRFYQAATVFEWRLYMRQYTGLVAMGCMSFAMILAMRPKWPEKWLGGLDKMYRLHKWFGITALIFAITHWLWINAPKWAVGWGLLARPARGGGSGQGRAVIDNVVEAWFGSQRGLAETFGEWTFYAVIVLIVLALIKTFPYHWFYKTHRLLALGYLVLVFHAAVLMEFAYWSQPVGWLTAALLIAGTIAAVLVLFRRVGARRKAIATITALRYFEGIDVLSVAADVPDWPGHKPGQFAFGMSDPSEGPHPYTIASAWNPERPELKGVVKALGDHTRRLRERLKVGQQVPIEGPYGTFTFDDDCPHQIWVGAGVGITPFISRLDHMALQSRQGRHDWPEGQRIELFHSTADVDDAALAKLAAYANLAADVHLHVLIDARDGLLTGERIRREVPGWREASIWFCGPAGFGDALRRDFARHGFPVKQRFHQELFELR